ncbi:MAG: archaeal proteasome endopeptidase complex subunit alpha [Candidatus Lokiarchaeota archaeon]|nr:archaeal proteasome endopeptidase complex subunit alpha [Candidatus Lokiarchaeota archaeon]
MFAPPGMGYDRAITIFSPDGRLFQVEYAIEAVRRGTTAIGIVSSEGVVTAVEKRILNLQEPDSIEKIFKIDEHIGCSIAGLTADARVLVDHARVQSQINKLTYDEDIDIAMLTKKISDLLQLYTQHAGVRPFGVSLLIIGVNPNENSPKLFMTDPSGAFWGYLAQAIGSGAQTVREILEKEYKEGITLDEAISLALKALKEVIESEFDSSKVEVAVIRKDNRIFERLSDENLDKYIKSI